MIKINQTNRGFDIGEFTDRYGSKCSIQKSSLAFEDCIWLGVDDPKPKIMTEDGWRDYEIPESVLISTRMHLTKEMAASLIPLLQNFVETGNLK